MVELKKCQFREKILKKMVVAGVPHLSATIGQPVVWGVLVVVACSWPLGLQWYFKKGP
jgi:hypothetical protein